MLHKDLKNNTSLDLIVPSLFEKALGVSACSLGSVTTGAYPARTCT